MNDKNNQQDKFFETDKKAYEMFLNGISLTRIAKELKIDRGSLTVRLKNKYSIKPNINGRKHSVDEHYFDVIDSEEKAYWLGFFYADAYNNGRRIEVGLQERDYVHLEKLNKALKSTYPIRPIKETSSFRLDINSKALAEALLTLGCVRNKSAIVSFPFSKIDRYLYKHFIRGIFDGDGTISKVQLRKETVKACTLPRYINKVSITTGSEKMADQLVGALKKYAYVDSYTTPDSRNNVKEIVIQGQSNIRTFLDFMYQDATVYLDRKYYQYLQYVLPSGVEMLQMINGEKIWNPAMEIRGEGSRIEIEDSDILD